MKEKKSEKKKTQSVSPSVTAQVETAPLVSTNVFKETPVLTNTDDNSIN